MLNIKSAHFAGEKKSNNKKLFGFKCFMCPHYAPIDSLCVLFSFFFGSFCERVRIFFSHEWASLGKWYGVWGVALHVCIFDIIMSPYRVWRLRSCHSYSLLSNTQTPTATFSSHILNSKWRMKYFSNKFTILICIVLCTWEKFAPSKLCMTKKFIAFAQIQLHMIFHAEITAKQFSSHNAV